MWLDILCTAVAIAYLELGLLMSFAMSKLYNHERVFVIFGWFATPILFCLGYLGAAFFTAAGATLLPHDAPYWIRATLGAACYFAGCLKGGWWKNVKDLIGEMKDRQKKA